MYKEAYQEENKVEVSVTQLVATAVIIMVALVLPAQYITSVQQGNQITPYTAEALRQRDQSTSAQTTTATTQANTLASGRVAGASSDGASNNTILGFRAETGILVLAGLLLIIVAASTGMYLMFTAPPKQKLPASWH